MALQLSDRFTVDRDRYVRKGDVCYFLH